MNGREDAFDPRGTAIPPSILYKEVEPSRREGQVTGAARINGQHYYQVTLEETALRPQTVYFVQEADGGTVYRLTDPFGRSRAEAGFASVFYAGKRE